MRGEAKARLLAIKRELLQAEREAEDEGSKVEREERGVDWPLEADEPEDELSHGERTPADLDRPDPADGFR